MDVTVLYENMYTDLVNSYYDYVRGSSSIGVLSVVGNAFALFI